MVSNDDALLDRNPNTHHGAMPHVDISRKMCTRADMNTICQITVVVYRRTGIDDHRLSNLRIDIDHGAGHHNRPAPQTGVATDSGPRMYEGNQWSSCRPKFQVLAQPHNAISNGNYHTLELVEARHQCNAIPNNRPRAILRTRWPSVIKKNYLTPTFRQSDIRNHLAMATGPEEREPLHGLFPVKRGIVASP